MNVEYFIANRLFTAKEKNNRYTKPILGIAILAIALSVAIMLISIMIVTGFKKDISDFSYPISIKMSKKGSGAILLIGVERGNEVTVEYSKKNIISKINSYFGYNFISEIKLKSINSIKKKMINNNRNQIKFSKNLDKKINEISNEKIKKSLSDLFKVMKK